MPFETLLCPDSLEAVHPPYDRGRLTELVVSMKEGGWGNNRSLFVEERRSGFLETRYFAWTGSHRIVAAVEAGLLKVPCLLLSQFEADEAFSKNFALGTWRCWRDAIGIGARDQEQRRLRALTEAGLLGADLLACG